jgi:hypothetical protein
LSTRYDSAKASPGFRTRDVVAVFVGHDLLHRSPVGRRLAGHDHLLLVEQIAAVGLGRMTESLDLGHRCHVHGQFRDLVSVHELRHEVGPLLVERVVDRIRLRDVHLHLLAGGNRVDAAMSIGDTCAREPPPIAKDAIADRDEGNLA